MKKRSLLEKVIGAWVALVFMFVFGGFVVGCLASTRGCMPNFSDGNRSGVVVKLSHKGVFAATKSWEGTLHLGGANAATGANTWDFSARDPAVVDQLRSAQESGRQVNLHYHQWAYKPFLIETDYEVDGVK